MEPGAIASLMKIITPAIGAVGAGGGIWNNIQNAKYQNMLRSLAMNPAKMMAYAKGFEQPLQAGLLKGVENEAQGYAAERGLATSPQLQQSIVSQAVAPYLQQQQNQALNAAYASLGLGGAAPPGGSTSDISSSLKMLQDSFPGKTTPPSVDPTTVDPYANMTMDQLLAQTSPSYNPYFQPEQQQAFNPQPVDLNNFAFGQAPYGGSD